MTKKIGTQIALLASIIALPHLAHAQSQIYSPQTQYGTYQYGAGYRPQSNIYDPMESAGMVTSGMSNLISESQQNYNMSRQGNTSDSSSSQSQKAKTPDTSASMGSDLLGTDSVKSIMGDDDDKKKKGELPSPDGTSDQDASNASKKYQLKLPKSVKGDTDKKDTKTTSAPQVTAPSIVKGYGRALDTITVSVNGQPVILNGLKGPGNGELCYREGVPWECGEEGRVALERLLTDSYITCSVGTGHVGSCITEDGQNLAHLVAERGYVIGTVTTTGRITHQARLLHKGIFQ